MTVVKDDEVATTTGEVSDTPEQAEVIDKDDLDFITDTKLSDDWSVIGKALDNEGSDGESVEVIPCEEEKSEAESCGADGTSNKLAVETRENIMQTEEIVLFRNFSLWHPGVIAFSIICHLLLFHVFYSVNEGGDIPDLISECLRMESPRSESRPSGPPPTRTEVFKDWEERSTRYGFEKTSVLQLLSHFFRSERFDEEIRALLEKDLMEDASTINVVHSKRHHYTKSTEPPNENLENTRFDCSNCKKYSSDCKKFCKHNKGKKNLKYYYDKIIALVVKKIKDNF